MSAHYSFPLEPHHISAEEVLGFVSAFLSRPITHLVDDSNGGGPELEATSSADFQGSHHQSLQVNMKIELDTHKGQIHILTIIITKIDSDIKRGHLINSGMVKEIDVTHITPQNPNTNIAKPTITLITVAILNISHLICLCYILQS